MCGQNKWIPLNSLFTRFSLPKCHFPPGLPVFLGLGGIYGIDDWFVVIGATFGQEAGGHGPWVTTQKSRVNILRLLNAGTCVTETLFCVASSR